MSDSFLEELEAAWRAEQREVEERARTEREDFTLAERVGRGTALRRLFVDDTGAATGGRFRLTLRSQESIDADIFQGSSGSPVVLWWDEPTQRDAVRGVLQRRVTDQIRVVVDDPPDRLFEGEFNLDLEATETTFRAGLWAMKQFAEAPAKSDRGELFRALVEGPKPVDATPLSDTLDQELNDLQERAVSEALAAETVAFLHGPPGTGKTRTLVEVVRQVVAAGGQVLCAAASNAAVDHLAASLIARDVDVVRLGHPARVSEAVEQHTLDARVEATPDWKLAKKWIDEANAIRRKIDSRSGRGGMDRNERRDLYRQARTLMGDAHHHIRRLEDAIVAHAPVICATTTGARSRILDHAEFDLVVVDEATQSPDPLTLIALLRAPKAVFAGDPEQLPPTVISTDAPATRLASTFHERQAKHAVMLEVQHRMNEAIMAFPSAASYGAALVASDAVRSHSIEDLGASPDPLRPGPLVFVDVAGKGWTDERDGEGASSYNVGMAERTDAEVRRIISRGVVPAQIAVITPYRAQVAQLRKRLPDGVDVDTIDAFQGRESEVVVVDLVRSNDLGEIGFLADTRRMNVALTRARRLLLVLGDSATIGQHSYYAAFLEAVESHGAWVSAWTDEAPLLD